MKYWIVTFILVFAVSSFAKEKEGSSSHKKSQCEIIKFQEGAALSPEKKEGAVINYVFGENKQLSVIHDSQKNEAFKIEYKSFVTPENKTDHIIYRLSCDHNLSCRGSKYSHLSYYKASNDLAVQGSNSQAILNYGGRDMFTLSFPDSNKFKFRFVDLEYPDGRWNGVEFECSK